MREGRNGCRGVFEIIDCGIAVRPRRIHGAKRRVIIQHGRELVRFEFEHRNGGVLIPWMLVFGIGIPCGLVCVKFRFLTSFFENGARGLFVRAPFDFYIDVSGLCSCLYLQATGRREILPLPEKIFIIFRNAFGRP